MIDNQEEKIKRFVQIQKSLKIKQKEFAEKIGLTQSKVSLINNGKAGTNILNEIFYRLHYEFGITKEWWESGKGEMLKSYKEDSNVFPLNKDFPSNCEELKEKYIKLLEDYNQLLKSKLNGDPSTDKSVS